MIERPTTARTRPPLLALGLLVLLAATSLLPDALFGGLVRLGHAGSAAAAELRAAIRSLPDRPLLLVGFDPDLGTYAEIRPAVRALLDDALGRQARLGIVSFSPEGRVLAVAEIDRLRRSGLDDDRLVDLGYRSGAEAGLVEAITLIVPGSERGPLSTAIRSAGGGLAAFDLVLLVGGTDFGPRAWVEQVAPRLPGLRLAAVAPTVLHPELAPYRRTGQLVALVATVRDGASYRDAVRESAVPPPDTGGPDRAVDAPAILVGLLVALATIADALARRLAGRRGAPA